MLVCCVQCEQFIVGVKKMIKAIITIIFEKSINLFYERV